MEVNVNNYTGAMPSGSNRPSRTVAIATFLNKMAPADLAQLYSHDMECQVNVAQGAGKSIKGEYRGKEYQAYTDGSQTWKTIRIPYHAGTNAEYEDKPISYDLAQHAESIGMTGWNWKEKKSIFVGFDFDSIANHSQGLSEEELNEILEKIQDIPWVTVRRSTSGTGYHLYVFPVNVETQNHHEHSALARSILSKMSSLTGFDFLSKVDVCGGNMWVWHRKYEQSKLDHEADLLDTEVIRKRHIGFELLKTGELLTDIPPNWRAHIKVTKKQSVRSDLNLPDIDQDSLDDVLNERAIVPLDEEHVKIIKALEGTDSWWDADHHILVTHTWSLKKVHEELQLRGLYDTISNGSAEGADRNCFCVPRSNGAWVIRRYSQVAEKPPWFVDAHNFSCCHYNRDPDFNTLATAFGGIETERRGFLFSDTRTVKQILDHLGVTLALPELEREVTVREDKYGKLILKIRKEDLEPSDKFPGFEPNKDKTWTRIIRNVNRSSEEVEMHQYDNLCRHLITTESDEAGWVIYTAQRFVTEPLTHIRLALAAKGFTLPEITEITGGAVLSPWKLVTIPFDREYPGDRQWNRNAPQLQFELNEDRDALYYNTWMDILRWCGQGLDNAVKKDSWCQDNGIDNGADYLKCWCASLFQEPDQPLPYLFFFGDQNSGKSIFHEALEMLFRPGYVKADNALTSTTGFNGELQNAILCVVEETDLSQNKQAYNKIKDWVTSPFIAIRPLYQATILVKNTTHWIQCANDHKFVPIIPGDTRVVVIEVPPLTKDQIIPKKLLLDKLRSEAADFLTEIMTMSIPQSPDRLNLPPLRTETKDAIEEGNRNELQVYLAENCHYYPGSFVSVAELHTAFTQSLTGSAPARWSKIRMVRDLPSPYIKGRHTNGTHIIGNISFKPDPSPDDRNRSLWQRQPGTDMLVLI